MCTEDRSLPTFSAVITFSPTTAQGENTSTCHIIRQHYTIPLLVFDLLLGMFLSDQRWSSSIMSDGKHNNRCHLGRNNLCRIVLLDLVFILIYNSIKGSHRPMPLKSNAWICRIRAIDARIHLLSGVTHLARLRLSIGLLIFGSVHSCRSWKFYSKV